MVLIIEQAVPHATWARMLAKARSEGIQVRQLGSGMWITTSGTDADAAYAVNLHECECPGHAYHGYCKHRAALAAKLGHLSVIEDRRNFAAPSVQRRRLATHSATNQTPRSSGRHERDDWDLYHTESRVAAAA
jgi:hypothetical protein